MSANLLFLFTLYDIRKSDNQNRKVGIHVKIRLIIATVMVMALCVPVLACSSGLQAAKTISCDDFSKQNHMAQEMQVSAGETFTVALCSNPSTGFSWVEAAQISDTNVVQQTKHDYQSAESNPPPPPGAPGQDMWTFKALSKGTCTIHFEYSRPWEGGEKGAWTYDLTVTVK
jgi:inhibitor of cysteine peptidase